MRHLKEFAPGHEWQSEDAAWGSQTPKPRSESLLSIFSGIAGRCIPCCLEKADIW